MAESARHLCPLEQLRPNDKVEDKMSVCTTVSLSVRKHQGKWIWILQTFWGHYLPLDLNLWHSLHSVVVWNEPCVLMFPATATPIAAAGAAVLNWFDQLQIIFAICIRFFKEHKWIKLSRSHIHYKDEFTFKLQTEVQSSGHWRLELAVKNLFNMSHAINTVQ